MKINHLLFCVLSVFFVLVGGDRLDANPDRDVLAAQDVKTDDKSLVAFLNRLSEKRVDAETSA